MLLRQGLSRRRALAATGLGLLASGGHAWAAEGEEARPPPGRRRGAAQGALRRQGATVAGLPEDERRKAHDKVKEAVTAALRNAAEPSIFDTVLAYAG